MSELENETVDNLEFDTESVNTPEVESKETTQPEVESNKESKESKAEESEDIITLKKTKAGYLDENKNLFIPAHAVKKERTERSIANQTMQERIQGLEEQVKSFSSKQETENEESYRSKIAKNLQDLYPKTEPGILKLVAKSTPLNIEDNTETALKKVEDFLVENKISVGNKRPLSFKGGVSEPEVEYDPKKGSTKDFWDTTSYEDRVEIFKKNPSASDQYLSCLNSKKEKDY